MALRIPVSPKEHAVMHHVGQFRGLKKRCLVLCSEQASEAAFTQTFSTYGIIIK
jgi:hypothetical protein